MKDVTKIIRIFNAASMNGLTHNEAHRMVIDVASGVAMKVKKTMKKKMATKTGRLLHMGSQAPSLAIIPVVLLAGIHEQFPYHWKIQCI